MAIYRFVLVNYTLLDRETGKTCPISPEHAQRFTDAIMGTDTAPAQSPEAIQSAMADLIEKRGA